MRLLLFADSHLGFDHPLRPRVRRRRRGLDFLAHHRTVCDAAIEAGVDLLVHGGDVFHRPNVPASLVHQAFAPLKRVAEAGIPVVVVPGNHERSRIPFGWLASHEGVHVLDRPRTVVLELDGAALAVSGFPCIRRGARDRFASAVEETAWKDHQAEVRVLLTHQTYEGATVGPAEFTFRQGEDVVPLSAIPAGFAAVLSGHIHRAQVLDTDLRGRPAPTPVLYPGSIERTAFAEMDEAKGYMMLDLAPSPGGGEVRSWQTRDLGARPMVRRTLEVEGLGATAVERAIRRLIRSVAPDTVLRVDVEGTLTDVARAVLRPAALRRLAPATMNVEVRAPEVRRRDRTGGLRVRRSARAAPGPRDAAPVQAELFSPPRRSRSSTPGAARESGPP